MNTKPAAPVPATEVHDFVTALLRSGLVLTDTLGGLIESIPEDAFPGEDPAEVVLEMLAGTLQPVADAAGRNTILEVTALMGAVQDKFIEDLGEAARLAKLRSPRDEHAG